MAKGHQPGTPRTPGSGRKKGTPNKATAELRIVAARARVSAARAGGMPLDHLLRVMNDPDQPMAMRNACAEAALPYLHPKAMPVDATDKPTAAFTGNLIQVNLIEPDKSKYRDDPPPPQTIEHQRHLPPPAPSDPPSGPTWRSSRYDEAGQRYDQGGNGNSGPHGGPGDGHTRPPPPPHPQPQPSPQPQPAAGSESPAPVTYGGLTEPGPDSPPEQRKAWKMMKARLNALTGNADAAIREGWQTTSRKTAAAIRRERLGKLGWMAR